MAPHSQLGKGARPHLKANKITQHQSAAIDLNPSYSEQAHSKRPGVGYGFQNKKPGCILTVFRVSIDDSSNGRHQTGTQYSAVGYVRDRAAVGGTQCFGQHVIFAGRLRSVTREDSFFTQCHKIMTKCERCLVLSKINRDRTEW